MRYLLGLILLISVSASAQYSPTAAKTRFVNGIGLGTKDTLSMNAADTVAMIVGRDSLVYFRYKGYWKPLAYNSSLTGYVPYTGATSSVNLGAYNLTATKIAIGGSISAVALDVHRAGSIVARIENTNSSQDVLFSYAQSAQNVWFTGIDYASGANNFGFYYSPDGTTVLRKAFFSNAGDLTANSFIKSGGTSSQFLKADGSVTTTIPSGSIDTGRAVTAIATGGSLNKVRDSLQANIGLKLNISDTATMLSSYYNKTATDSRLALKVNYTDTATMLSPYQRSYNAMKYTDTATMLSGYKTYYPRAALSAGTGITYNASTGVITNSSPSTGGTVTSVATNTGSGITGGTITTSGTIAADTSVLSTKANVTASLLSKVSSVSGTSPIASSGGLTPTISISQSSGSTNGYLSSTDWNTFNNKGSGSVTSVATDATMTGGTITTSGTLKVDTSVMATRLRVQKGIDSLGAAKIGGSGTTNYIPKFTSSSAIGNSLLFDNGTNVGIGTSSPSAKFVVSNSNALGYEIDPTSTSGTVVSLFSYDRTAAAWKTTRYSSLDHRFEINGVTEAMRITSGGNVGIGTTSPTFKLDVKQSIDQNGIILRSNLDDSQLRLVNNNSGYWQISATYGTSGSYQPITFLTSDTERMRITSSGRLLLGTSTEDTYLLDVNGTGRFSSSVTASGYFYTLGGFQVKNNGYREILLSAANATNRWNLYSYGADETGSNAGGNLYLARYNDDGSYLAQVFGITRATGALSYSGNVLIGSTVDAGYKLQVNGSLAATNAIFSGSVQLTSSGSSLSTTYGGVTTMYQLVDASGGILKVDGDNTIRVVTNNVNRFQINSTAATFTTAILGTSATFSSSITATNGIFTGSGIKIPSNSAGSGSTFTFDYTTNAASRTWRLANDYQAYGDFAIQQSTTQTGSTYANILYLSSTGAATFSSSVTTGGDILIGASASTIGALNFVKTGASPVCSRITFGTDGTGYSFTIAKNQSNTITDLLSIADNGAATFSSSVTAVGFFESSDKRLKNIVSRSGDMVTFKWKSGDTLLHYGYIAQEVEKTMPDQVKTDEKGMKSVNYIEILVKKINDLESRIKQLEK